MAAKPPQVTVSCLSGTTKGLCARPLETFARPLPEIGWWPTLAGRGGSVSRRDRNQPAENRAHLTGGTKPKETPPPKRQPLFGREGSGGRGASLREAASPPSVPPKTTSLQEGARGRVLLYREAPSPGVPLPSLSHHRGDFLDGALGLGDDGVVAEEAENDRRVLENDTHVVRDAVILACLVRYLNSTIVQIEGHLAVQALIAQNSQHLPRRLRTHDLLRQ